MFPWSYLSLKSVGIGGGLARFATCAWAAWVRQSRPHVLPGPIYIYVYIYIYTYYSHIYICNNDIKNDSDRHNDSNSSNPRPCQNLGRS